MAPGPLRARLRALLESDRAPRVAVLLAVVLCLPALSLGYLLDDYIFSMGPQLGVPAWNYFDSRAYASSTEFREGGGVGWWAGDDFRLHFFRPITSFTHFLDYTYWPGAPWVMHAFNVALYAALVAVVGVAYRRFGLRGRALGVATLLYAIDDAHAPCVGWISGRNALLSSVFGGAMLVAHDKWRRDGWRPGPLVVALLFLAALFSAEAGLAFGAYVIAYAALLEERPARERLLSLAPYAIVFVPWIAAYAAFDLGPHGTWLYVDARATPGLLLASLVKRAFILLAAQLTLPGAIQVDVTPYAWLGAAAIVILVAFLLRPLFARDRLARFFGVGAVLSTFPFAATVAQDRLLFPVGLGAFGVLARLLVVTESGELAGRGVVWTRRALFAFAAVLAPLLFVPQLSLLKLLQGVARPLVDATPVTTDMTVALNAPTDLSFLYPPAMRAHEGTPWPKPFYPLSTGVTAVHVTRDDEATIELASDAGWFATPMDRLARPAGALSRAGDVVRLAHMTATVLEVTPDGRPTRCRFAFDRPLERIHWLAWDPRGPAAWTPPAVGGHATIEAPPKPF